MDADRIMAELQYISESTDYGSFVTNAAKEALALILELQRIAAPAMKDKLVADAARASWELRPCGHAKKYEMFGVPGGVTCMICRMEEAEATVRRHQGEPISGKFPISRPCSACSGGDEEMKHHDHEGPADPQYTNRHGERCSQACGEGRHAECTETFTTCSCTYRGLHKTAHVYETIRGG